MLYILLCISVRRRHADPLESTAKGWDNMYGNRTNRNDKRKGFTLERSLAYQIGKLLETLIKHIKWTRNV